MPLIFVNRFFYPDHSATSQLLSDLAFSLADEGETVRVIASRQAYDSTDVTFAKYEVVNGVNVHRIWTTHFGRKALVGRAVDYATFYASCAWQLLKLAHRGDVIIAKTDPPMLSVIAAPIARIKGARLVNWLQDIFPEVAEVVGVGRGPLARTAYRVMRALRNMSLRHADMNVVLGERMAGHVAALGIDRNRIRIIPNWADGALLSPVPPDENPLRSDWGLSGRFVAGYSGNLGRAHEYGTLLDAIGAVEARIASASNQPSDRSEGGREQSRPRLEIVWLFIGGGTLYEEMRREATCRKLKSIRFQPYQPRERLSHSLSAADVHLVSLRPELEGLIVPSKFYGVAAVGRPTVFIGDSDGEIARILKRYDCGRTVGEGNAVGLADVVMALAANTSDAERLGRNARIAFEQSFDRPGAIASWQRLLGSVTNC